MNEETTKHEKHITLFKKFPLLSLKLEKNEENFPKKLLNFVI